MPRVPMQPTRPGGWQQADHHCESAKAPERSWCAYLKTRRCGDRLMIAVETPDLETREDRLAGRPINQRG